jgi:hypothetical protein
MAPRPNNAVILESVHVPTIGCFSRVTARYCGSSIDHLECMPGSEPQAVTMIIRRHFSGLLRPDGTYDPSTLYLNDEAAQAYAMDEPPTATPVSWSEVDTSTEDTEIVPHPP